MAKPTTKERVAEDIASSLEGRKVRLNIERAELAAAAVRIAEIDEELVEIDKELEVYASRRPKKDTPANDNATRGNAK